MVDTHENKFTDSWQSLKACQDGIKVMRASGNFDSAKARRCFETALTHDAANWIARFYLALSLCSEDKGKPATALRHFEILDDVLGRAVRDQAFKHRVKVKLVRSRVRRSFLGLRARFRPSSEPRAAALTGLLDHLVHYPECPFILQYNIAIALEELRQNSGPQEFKALLARSATWKDPLESLADLAALQDPNAVFEGKFSQCARLLQSRERLELSLYAQSARAHIMSMRDPARHIDELREILKSMDVTCDDLRCLDRKIASWKALETTKAVALASLARALTVHQGHGANQEARELLYQAIACEPHLVDAYLQLAKLYMHSQERFAKDWAGRAESLLTRADEMNPTCGTKVLLSELQGMTARAGDQQGSEAATA